VRLLLLLLLGTKLEVGSADELEELTRSL